MSLGQQSVMAIVAGLIIVLSANSLPDWFIRWHASFYSTDEERVRRVYGTGRRVIGALSIVVGLIGLWGQIRL